MRGSDSKGLTSVEEKLVVERDYSKFLGEDGRLDVKLLPRQVYTRMVKEYRTRDAVLEEVFGQHYWLWDLEEAERKAIAEGREVSRGELAQEVFAMMDDTEWWQVMESIEAHFIQHFHECLSQWAEFLDPVYDDLEERGWPQK